MNDLLTVTDELLDEMFSHEAGCQSRHDSGRLICSVVVTHRFTSCVVDRLFCMASAQFVAAEIASHKFFCADCHRPEHDCWSVIPV